jgi:hypothetical protein
MSSLKLLLDIWQETGEESGNATARALNILNEAKQQFENELDDNSSRELWLEFLDITRRKGFLLALRDPAMRHQWAELVCLILQRINYSLLDMMEQRVAAHPNQTLFRDQVATVAVDWSYDQIYRHLKEIAGYFFKIGTSEPRVAVYTENCLEGACVDLACLMFDIYDTPISPHFKQDILVEIFKMLKINVALADTGERLQVLQGLRQKLPWTLEISPSSPSRQS